MNEVYFAFIGSGITVALVLMLWIIFGAFKSEFSYMYFLVGFMTAITMGILVWASANTSQSFNGIYITTFCNSVKLPTSLS